MSQLSNSPNSIEDERLADFTDRALAGKVERADADADAELLALEQTVLRLKNAFSPTALDPAAAKQMQVRFNARVKREERAAAPPFWKKWFEPQLRLQFTVAFAAVAAVIAVAVLTPGTVTDTSASGTAMQPAAGIAPVIILAGILFIFFWFKRRK